MMQYWVDVVVALAARLGLTALPYLYLQAYSGLCGEGMVHGGMMGLKTVFTDHSLFGFADLNSILTNKLMEFFLTNTDHLICVSYTRSLKYFIHSDTRQMHTNAFTIWSLVSVV